MWWTSVSDPMARSGRPSVAMKRSRTKRALMRVVRKGRPREEGSHSAACATGQREEEVESPEQTSPRSVGLEPTQTTGGEAVERLCRQGALCILL